MARPGTTWVRRRPVNPLDVAALAKSRAPLPVLITALIAIPYIASKYFEKPIDPELLAQGTVIAPASDPWPGRILALGIIAWGGLTAADVLKLGKDRERRLMRLDEDELECWPDRVRRHVALQDLLGARLDQAMGGRGYAIGSKPRGVVLYVRPPGKDTVEQVKFDAGACVPLDVTPSEKEPWDGNTWLIRRLRELVWKRRAAGRPVAVCPRMPIEIATERNVAMAGDERVVSVSAGPKHLTVHAGTVAGIKLVKPEKEKDEVPPLRRVIVELKPGCADKEILVDLDDSPDEDKALEWFLFTASRFDV